MDQASQVTTARSQVEVAQAERDQYKLWWESSQAALGDLMHEHADAMAALQEAFDESGWAESYVLKDGTLHPGATSTVAAVFKALYPEGKAK